MTDDRTYLDHLQTALQRRGLDAERAAAVAEEVADHLLQSGETALDAFGEPERYAAALLAADDPAGRDGPGDPMAAAGSPADFEQRTFRATALDEERILDDLGRDGWELTGVRDFGLHARRPIEPHARRTWEHRRRGGLRAGPLRAQMESEGWTPSGRWLTFHYFKRPASGAR